MAKARPRGHGEAIKIFCVPGTQLGLRRLLKGGEVGQQEVHLLRQPPTDDLVVLAEAERLRLAHENALDRLLPREVLHLHGIRDAPALRHEHRGDPAEIGLGNLDPHRVAGGRRGGRRQGVPGSEQKPAPKHEMRERIARRR